MFKSIGRVRVLGEESLDPDVDLSGDEGLVALLDTIDGTDLLIRGFGNWCSAAIFFENGRILASFVALYREGVYFATENKVGVFREADRRLESLPLRGLGDPVPLSEATICAYGQKFSSFARLARRSGLVSALESAGQTRGRGRFYTLAGNPMSVRLVDAPVPVHAVFDAEGQMPHDVAPGAHIAVRAGATLLDLDGQPIDLGQALLHPGDPEHRMRYVLANTEELARELVEVLRSS